MFWAYNKSFKISVSHCIKELTNFNFQNIDFSGIIYFFRNYINLNFLVMKQMRNFFSLVVIAILMFSFTVLDAQTPQEGQGQQPEIEVSDSELETFATIMQAIQEFQKDAQMVITQTIADNPDIDMQQYQEISKAKRQGQEVDLSEEEEEAFNAIQQVIQEQQKKMDEEIESLLEEHEMEQKRYMEINHALQKDKELQERLQKFMTPQQPQQ